MLKIFLATAINEDLKAAVLPLGYPYFLLSFAAVKNGKAFTAFYHEATAILGQRPKLFFDSGAYSVDKRGIKIDLQEYIGFIKENERQLWTYANLDVIKRSERTWANQGEMEAQGLSPLPVYHHGEEEKYFDMALQYDYFAVGGLKQGARDVRFFDQVFARICPASNGYLPTHKVHGFGMTDFAMMRRYPWYSVDSTTWLKNAAFWMVFIPRKVNGAFSYEVDPLRICISSRSPKSGKAGRNFFMLTKGEKKIVEEYFEAKGFKVGKSLFVDGKEIIEEPGLCNNYQLRLKANALYFSEFARSRPECPWPFTRNK